MSAAEELLTDGSVTVNGATKEYGVGRTRLYELMTNGELPYSQLGAKRLIPRAAIRRLLAAHLIGFEAVEQTAK